MSDTVQRMGRLSAWLTVIRWQMDMLADDAREASDAFAGLARAMRRHQRFHKRRPRRMAGK